MRSTHRRWHLDELFVKVNGVQHTLWCAVDHEGEVLEAFGSKTRDKMAALKFLRRLIQRHGRPEAIVTDGLKSYGAALKEIGAEDRQVTGRWENNRAENSHQPFRRRERAMQRFRRRRSQQTFAAVHSTARKPFNSDRSPSRRPLYKQNRAAGLGERRALCAA